jgi:hypothetical protein
VGGEILISTKLFQFGLSYFGLRRVIGRARGEMVGSLMDHKVEGKIVDIMM